MKIYFGSKPLYLCDSLDEELSSIANQNDVLFIRDASADDLKKAITETGRPATRAVILRSDNFEELISSFRMRFTVIQAGGGLVRNKQGEVLVIFRRGKWDLPKGKLDDGETIEQCALREVREETGLTSLQLQSELLTTYHTYPEQGKFILKENHWYGMQAEDDEPLIPQESEDIAEARWASREEITKMLRNTYPSVAEVLALI